jgi:Glycosyl hydrolases family 18
MALHRLRGIAAVASAALAAATAVVGIAASPAQAATTWPTHVSAPYVDTGMSNTTLTSVASSYGDKYFTLAFVDGANCAWSMYNTASWQTQIANLRAAGGDVSISFGGYTTDNGGTDLGNTCSSAAAAAAQIENVVTTFNVTHLDFDIEAAELTNHADVDRTNQALAQVRSWASGSGRSLSISYTLPVLPGGLTSDGLYVLSSGRSNGFTPNVVNVMAMDYGSSGTEMGSAANQAMDASAGQVASAYGLSTAQAYAMLGVTPMIGQNDSAGEIFTVADASTVEAHAAAEGIAELSFWSEGRDNGGCPGSTTASSTCSGVSQNTGDFTSTFQQFAGSSGGGGGTTGSTYSVLPGTWASCASEGGTCGVSGSSVVAFGAGGRFNYAGESSATSCSDSVFGDPDSGVVKSCYDQGAPPGSNTWAACSAENGTCSFTGVMTVAYGANGGYAYATLGGGTACSNSVFGDPSSGNVKTCYVMGAPPSFTTWTDCSAENGSCSFSGTHEVAFGANGQYFYGSFNGGTGCSNAVFGDPDNGVVKACYVQ